MNPSRRSLLVAMPAVILTPGLLMPVRAFKREMIVYYKIMPDPKHPGQQHNVFIGRVPGYPSSPFAFAYDEKLFGKADYYSYGLAGELIPT